MGPRVPGVAADKPTVPPQHRKEREAAQRSPWTCYRTMQSFERTVALLVVYVFMPIVWYFTFRCDEVQARPSPDLSGLSRPSLTPGMPTKRGEGALPAPVTPETTVHVNK